MVFDEIRLKVSGIIFYACMHHVPSATIFNIHSRMNHFKRRIPKWEVYPLGIHLGRRAHTCTMLIYLIILVVIQSDKINKCTHAFRRKLKVFGSIVADEAGKNKTLKNHDCSQEIPFF